MSQAIAIPFPAVSPRESVASVAASPPKVEYLLTMLKGALRPPEDKLPAVREAHEKNENAPIVWEGMGVYESRGAANAAIKKIKELHTAHPRDLFQISPYVLNAIPSWERFHLSDNADEPPEYEYKVVRIRELEEIRNVLRDP